MGFWARYRLEFLVSFGCLLLLGMFSSQYFEGTRGIVLRSTLQKQASQHHADFIAVSNQRQMLEQRVELLRPNSVDADLVDELARRDLNMGKAGDIVIQMIP